MARHKWTSETRLQLAGDAEFMNIKDLSKHWGMTQKGMKSVCTKYKIHYKKMRNPVRKDGSFRIIMPKDVRPLFKPKRGTKYHEPSNVDILVSLHKDSLITQAWV